jgi:hypothetical protein
MFHGSQRPTTFHAEFNNLHYSAALQWAAHNNLLLRSGIQAGC